MRMYTGIDGCRGGWVYVQIFGAQTRIGITERISQMHFLSDSSLTLIDIPIGLPEDAYRACDIAARALLSPARRQSVFFTPTREAVYASGYREACEINFERTGKKIFRQVWGLAGKIREVDAWLRAQHAIEVIEAHPELCFRALNGNRDCSCSKHTDEGFEQRISILKAHLPSIDSKIHGLLRETPRKLAARDDIVDAAVLAVCASHQGRIRELGDGKTDRFALPMRIVYPER